MWTGFVAMWPGHSHTVCVYEGPVLAFWLCFCLLKIRNNYWPQGPVFPFCPQLGSTYGQSCHHPTLPPPPCTYVITLKACYFQKFSVYVSLEALGFMLMGLFYTYSLLSLPPQCRWWNFSIKQLLPPWHPHPFLPLRRHAPYSLQDGFANSGCALLIKMYNTSLLCIE